MATSGTVSSTAASVPRHSDCTPSCCAILYSPSNEDLGQGKHLAWSWLRLTPGNYLDIQMHA